MANHHLAIADELTTELKDHNWSLDFTPERRLLPRQTLEQMEEATLYVTVMPARASFTPATRDKDEEAYAVDVAFQKLADPADPTETDPVLDLMEEIRLYFRRRRLAASKAAAVQTEYLKGADAGYSWVDLDESRVMFCLARFHFQVVR